MPGDKAWLTVSVPVHPIGLDGVEEVLPQQTNLFMDLTLCTVLTQELLPQSRTLLFAVCPLLPTKGPRTKGCNMVHLFWMQLLKQKKGKTSLETAK